METELMNLSWNEFHNSTIKTFRNLQKDEDFTDVTLACGSGSQVKAHKVILSSCSQFFKDILVQNPHQHPLLYLKGVQIDDLKSLIKFIYSGEVEVPNEGLGRFLEAANDLKIEGLQQKPKQDQPNSKKRKKREIPEDKELEDDNIMERIESKIQKMAQLNSKYKNKNKKIIKEESPDTDEDKIAETEQVIEADEAPLEEESSNDGDIIDDEVVSDEVMADENIPNEDIADEVMADEDNEDTAEAPTDPYQDDIKFDEVVEDTTGGLHGYTQTEIKSSKNTFQCSLCPRKFILETELEEHKEEEHNIRGGEDTTETDADLQNEEPWNQIDNNDGKSCNVCFKKFTTNHSMQEHKDAIHENIRFLCDHCEHISSSKRNLRGHINKKHPDKELPVTYTKIKSDNSAVKSPKKSVKSFKKKKSPKESPESIKEERIIVVPEMLPQVGPAPEAEPADEAAIDEKIDAITEWKLDGTWNCTECGHTAKSKFLIRRHAEGHLSGFMHQCQECLKTFTTRSNANQHRLRMHTAPVPESGFACDKCDKTAPNAGALRTHRYRNHSIGNLGDSATEL